MNYMESSLPLSCRKKGSGVSCCCGKTPSSVQRNPMSRVPIWARWWKHVGAFGFTNVFWVRVGVSPSATPMSGLKTQMSGMSEKSSLRDTMHLSHTLHVIMEYMPTLTPQTTPMLAYTAVPWSVWYNLNVHQPSMFDFMWLGSSWPAQVARHWLKTDH